MLGGKKREKPGIMDLVRELQDPDLIDAIRELKSHKDDFRGLDFKKIVRDIEEHAKMLELSYKHVQVIMKVLEHLHPEETKQAKAEVNEAWRKAGRGENGSA